jgi:hypothetical protein
MFDKSRREFTDGQRLRCNIYTVLARFERLAFGALTLLARCKRTYCATRTLAVVPALDIDEYRPTPDLRL